MWGDIAGHWFYLTGLNSAFLNAQAYTVNSAGQFLETRPISVGATADVYLDDNEPLRVFTYGYDSDDFEGWFGSILRNRYDLGTEMIKQVLDRGGCCDSGNIDNDSLGGAFFEAPVTSNLGGSSRRHAAAYFRAFGSNRRRAWVFACAEQGNKKI